MDYPWLDWVSFEFPDSTYGLTLPSGNFVYVIMVRKNRCKKQKLAYIGVTKCLVQRFLCSSVLMLLRANKKGYKIFVYYKSFGEISFNRSVERRYIKDFTPALNFHHLYKKSFSDKDFWGYLGVESVKKKRQANWENKYVLKKWFK